MSGQPGGKSFGMGNLQGQGMAQAPMAQGVQNPNLLAQLEGRYVAPTGAGYQYYQGGSTAPAFNPQVMQAMLQQTLAAQQAKQMPQQRQQMRPSYGPTPPGLAQYGLFPYGMPSFDLSRQQNRTSS